MKKYFSIKIERYIYFFSLLNLIIYNKPFFLYIWNIKPNIFISISFFIFFFLLFNLFFSLVFYKKTTKFLSILFLICNSLALYFINTYKIQIDVHMLINLFETNVREASDFINLKMFSYFILLGVFPSILIYFLKIDYNYKKRYKIPLISLIGILIIAALSLGVSKKSYSFVKRQRRKITYVIPANYIGGLGRYVSKNIKFVFFQKKVKSITTNSQFNLNINNNKKNLFIFIIGESARSMNFSLNGYDRETDKFLKKHKNLISFSNTAACGTATAHAIPCMFSHLSRENFTPEKGKQYENLLDFFSKFNFNVNWRSNNGDCKDVCNRVNYLSVSSLNSTGFDDSLTINLKKDINNINTQNSFFVLNQRGSHNPLLYKRYPKEFEIYKPACQKNMRNCEYEELLNAYDNSIAYSNYNINEIIEFLKTKEDEYNIILLYISDHGEGLGGKENIFVHGMQYEEANDYVLKVPFILWFSENSDLAFNIDLKCLEKKKNNQLAQDNIFHSILGLFNIQTEYYNESLDIFKSCRMSNNPNYE